MARAKKKECEVHKWKPRKLVNNWGYVLEDVCTGCGAIGEVSAKPDKDGFYQIVPKPVATVFNMAEYRLKKGQADVKD